MYKIFESEEPTSKNCPTEKVEQVTFLNWLKKNHPEFAGVAVHIKNEGKRSGKEIANVSFDKAMGMVTGAADIIIPCTPAFVMELKREHKPLTKLSKEQDIYLYQCDKLGAWSCLCYGHKQAIKSFQKYLDMRGI